jgi:hypothetical protein
VTTTPLGVDVEPEVYCRKAGSAATTARRTSPSGAVVRSSVASQSAAASSGTCAAAWRTAGRVALDVSTTRGDASRAMALRRG